MERVSAALRLLALCAVLSSTCFAESRSDPVLTIGAVLPLTGNAASVGSAIQAGISIASEELSPELQGKIAVVYEDDMNLPRNTAAAAAKLVTSQKVNVLLTTSAQPSMAAAPLADQYKVPLISVAVPPKIVAGRTHAVLFFSTSERMGRVAVEEATRRGYERIARISSIHDGRASQAAMFDRANGGRIELVLNDEYPLSERDFRASISRIKRMPAVDAIYANFYVGQIGAFAKQARELGLTLPIFTTDYFIEDEQEVESAHGALNGSWYVTQDDPSPSFVDRYRRQFPGRSLVAAANGHDIIRLLAAAIERGAVTPEALNQFLHNAKDISGALGTYSASGDNRFDIPVAVKMIGPHGPERLRGGQ